MNPKDIEVGRTYHNGNGKSRKVRLIGNRHNGNADLYYEPKGVNYWVPMSLKGFARWAKGEVRESTPKEDTSSDS